ncbi:MAG: alpha-amylase family protein [Lentisphaeria bacterium]
MAKFKYALFYDFHTLATNPEVGIHFDAEAFTDQMTACGVDFLTFHARCNQGNAYYNTKVGRRHPSLKFDLIKDLSDACQRKGIILSLYFNGHLSEEETLAHPEWADVPMQQEQRLQRKESPFFHQVCYNSGFGDHMLEMVKELLAGYAVDGFFFDCLGPSDCVCHRCVAEMKEKGIDWTDLQQVRQFSDFSCDRMCQKIIDGIKELKPDALLFFNGRPKERYVGQISHLEAESVPAWGMDNYMMSAHYLRTLTGSEKSVLNMNGRFDNWGDFGCVRDEISLEADMFYGVANGMRPDVGGHLHPRGDLDLPVFDLIHKVYANMQQYDKWSLDAVNDNEIAIVFNSAAMSDPFISKTPAKGAVRMLDELKYQFDMVSEFAPWDKYQLLIFPDKVTFNDEVIARVRRHLAKGGRILASSASGLDAAGASFALTDEWPVVYRGKTSYDPLFFQSEGGYAEGLADGMALSVYASGISTSAALGAEVEMRCVKPYVNFGWDGIRGNYYIPPQDPTDEPFLAVKGNITYIAGEIFQGYWVRASLHLRRLLSNVMAKTVSQPKLRTTGLPGCARAVVQKKDRFEMVHLIAYAQEKRGDFSVIEDRVLLNDVELQLRTEGKNVRTVFLAPTLEKLPFVQKDGYCKAMLPKAVGYALVVFEF